MARFHTMIGEHLVQMICDSDQMTYWIERNFPVVDTSNRNPDLFIQLTGGYGTPFVDYHVEISKESHKILFQRADYCIETSLDYQDSNISVHNELALKHALMNLYSSYLVYHQCGLLIHSSCAIDKGKAYMFAGHSGAGKSTAAKLSHPRELLSDEATIIKITPGQITVYDSPFRSELVRTGAGETSPLTNIYLLHQAMDNQLVPLSKSNSLLFLMNKVFYWSHSLEETRNIFRLLQQVVHSVAIFELHFQKNETFWELIS
ncbi:hypothetical protein P5G65_27550 [Paenibacillus chondroitinus]|uniref:SynChlorMet cassette protein ScmC n=1 Tax=Paenibacillus chondroitinus TaxID=59842 RepID=A0ABU6DK12_9BACL|nr:MULTISPECIES: hypothetical protein [Paenibacillus]MCY9660234.1 hypothetical protein [Paenibacillus anseongense]MEB4797660.1 hypothetical protein [Paenibacillus chondroitinus]